MKQLIAQLIELVRDSAPVLWQIAQRQVLADVVVSTTTLVFLLVLIAVSIIVAKKYYEDVTDTSAIAATVAIIASVSVPIVASRIMLRLISPDYYAIKVLMDLVKQ